MADQKFKSKISAEAGVALPAESASKVLQLDGSGNVQSSSVTTTELGYVSGVTSAIQTQLGNKIDSSEKGANNGVATLDAGGKVPASQLTNSVMEFKGAWDASSNTPTLADGSGNAGDVYRVSVAGSQDLGSGSQSYVIGDWVMYNGSIWQKSPGTDAVLSVNGATGVVTVNAVINLLEMLLLDQPLDLNQSLLPSQLVLLAILKWLTWPRTPSKVTIAVQAQPQAI